MKYLAVLVVSLFLVACASNAKEVPGTNLDEKLFELNVEKKTKSDRTFSEIKKESSELNQYVGSYPPKFSDENQRVEIFKRWLSLVSDAEAYAAVSSNKEKSYYILAELYRQGHNMDVKGSAERANENLGLCFSSFPKSIPCNLSASYFYLSIGPNYLGQAERSLDILREHYSSDLNPEVEGGYVFLYLYQRDVEKAKKQIDKYLENFPNTGRARDFSVIKANLGDKIGVKQH